MLAKAYNSLVTLFYFYVTYRGVLLIFIEAEENRYKNIIYQYGLENRNKYLSIWVSFLQLVYFIIVFFGDVVDTLPLIFKCPRWFQEIQSVRQYLLTTLVLPLTLYIFSMFWSFYLYDREMIYPELFDRYIPPWLNYAMHFYPVPILLVHLVICPTSNPSRKSALLGLTFVFIVYGIIFLLSVMKGNWVYLLFNHLEPWQRMLFLSISYPLTILFLILSRWLNKSFKGFKEKRSLKCKQK